MPYIYVETRVILDELEDKDIIKEMDERELVQLSSREACDTLLNVADWCRTQGRNDYAFRLDEIRMEIAS